ncbi:DUF6702 family protein [Crocinitomix catalasitica]|uniref:DUF6702 family protein n=1 Tax=Crocinitomix catalasitica TaxID=184607 RepID=UPI000486D43F|nr:DUF6702 family protein [Crocinitomix catalasitica]
MKYFILSILFIFSAQSYAHKYYVSISDLKYNAETETIEGYVKVTAHDLEMILSKAFLEEVELENVSDTSIIGLHIQQYLNENLKIYSNGVQAKQTYVGKEVTLRDELFIYFTFTGIKDPSNIEIHNSLLYEYFKAQQNIVHYKYKKQTKSVTLSAAKNRGILRFEN